MQQYPQVHEKMGSLLIGFAPVAGQTSEINLRIVLDFSEHGEVIGVEILNLVLETKNFGRRMIEQLTRDGGRVKSSYDEESDSLYLRLADARSRDQRAMEGSLLFDVDGKLLRLSANWR